MEEIEIRAATVEQAIEQAEARLGLSRDEFEVEVLKEGRAGVLGMGAAEALIRVTLVAPPEAVSPEPDQADNVQMAAEVLEKLLRLLGVAGRVDVLSYEMPPAFDIVGDDLGILIGRRGQTLAALEYVTKLIVTARLQTWLPLTVDVGGYKKRRYDSLQKLALYLAEQVKSGRRPITMEPMPADERRIVHIALTDNPDVTTYSIGEGESRKVVVSLRES